MSDMHILLLGLAVWGIIGLLCRVDKRVAVWVETQARKSNDRQVERAGARVVAEAERLCRESCNG